MKRDWELISGEWGKGLPFETCMFANSNPIGSVLPSPNLVQALELTL
jgi:hypothetical protein